MSSDKSLEELLKLLEENKHIAGNEVEAFIKEHSISESKKCTHTYIIYWVYLKWKSKVLGEPIPRNIFFKKFKKYFKPASRDRVRRYYVQSKHFVLHPDEIILARKECGREREWHGSRRGGRITGKLIAEKHPDRIKMGLLVRKRNQLRKRKGI